MRIQNLDPVTEQLKRLDERLAPKQPLVESILVSCPMVPAAAGLIIGISLQHSLRLNLYWSSAAGLLALFSCLLSCRIRLIHQRANLVGFCLILMFICLGMLRLEYFYMPRPDDVRFLLRDESYPATLRGIIISDIYKEDRHSWFFGNYQFTEPARSFYLSVEEYQTQSGGWAGCTGNIRVQVARPVGHIRPFDKIQMYCVITSFAGPSNPGQFDFQSYMHNRGVYLAANVETAEGITILNRPDGFGFRRAAMEIRRLAWDALMAEMPDETDQRSAMAAALLLGNQRTIDLATNEAFIKTGLSHIISLSGMHLAIIAMMVWQIAKIAGLEKRKRAIFIFIVITLYALVVPPRAPTLRAVVICWFFCAAMIFRRKPNPINTLAAAAVILLLFRPTDLLYPDWQLSYGTLMGILLLYKPIRGFWLQWTLEKIASWPQRNFILRTTYSLLQILVDVFSAGFAAWLGGAGILLWNFGSIVPLCPLWTALISPIVPVILYLGFFKILLIGLFPTVAGIFGWIIAYCSDIFIWAVQFFARLDFTSLRLGPMPGWIGAVFYVPVMAWLLKDRIGQVLLWGITIVTGAGLIWGIYNTTTKYHSRLELTCLSVGHGQAIVVRSPEGRTFLFDGGSITSKDPGSRSIIPFLKYAGLNRLDAVFISHGDLDHFNALPELAQAGFIRAVYAGTCFLDKTRTPSSPENLTEFLKNFNISIQPVSQLKNASGPMTIRRLWPIESEISSMLSDNDRCEVFLIEYADRKILICGDIEAYAQQKLLQLYPQMSVDVLILPHHGSTTNLSQEFVRRLANQIVIASCARTRMAGVWKSKTNGNIFYTGRDGAIEVKIKADSTVSAVGHVNSNKP